MSSPSPPRTTIGTAVSSRLATRRRLARLFFAVGAALALFGAGAIGLQSLAVLPGMRGPMMGACLVMAAGFGWAWHVAREGRLSTTVVAAAWFASGLLVMIAYGTGQGLRTVSLGYVPLLVCLVAALTGAWRALPLALAAIAAVLWLATLGASGSLPVAASIASAPWTDAVVAHLMLLTGGLATGLILARVTDRAFRAADEREHRFESLLDVSVDHYFELDADLCFADFRFTARASERHAPAPPLGVRPWEVEGFEFVDPSVEQHKADLIAHRPFRGLVVRRTLPGGGTIDLSLSGTPRLARDGRFEGYWGIGRNVTLQVAQQRELARSEARYRGVFAYCPSPLVLHRSGRVMDANPAALDLFGYAQREDFVGHELAEHAFDAPGLGEAIQARFDEVSQSEPGTLRTQFRFGLRRVDGARREVSTVCSSLELEDGPAMLSFFHDETAHVAAQRQLEESQALQTHLLATSPDVITLTEMATGRYLMVNDTFCEVTGWRSDEVIGRTAVELGIWASVDDRDRVVAQIRDIGHVDGWSINFLGKHGQHIPLTMSATRFALGGQDYLVINARDMSRSERIRLEYEAILENVSIGIAYTRDGLFVHGNRRCEEMFGWTAGDLVGKPTRLFWRSEAEYGETADLWAPVLAQGRAVDTERSMTRRDGSEFLCRVQAQAIDPTHPSRGGTIWLFEDVTERRRVERALAQARDAAESASRAKSAFLANISHEIRTPLNGLLGLAQLARQPQVDSERQREYLRQIQLSAQGLAGIISDVLDLSKIEAGKLVVESVPFSLRTLLRDLHNSYQPLAEPRGLVMEMRIEDEVPDGVRGDPLRLRQILGNYLSNALKFTETGRVRVHVERAPGEAVHFSVEDTGPGIEAEIQARLFEPFSQADTSTTRRFGGTGLGLSICRELAMLMRGEVGLASQPGVGSRFWLRLPLPGAALPAAAPAPADVIEAADTLAGMRVLVAEDNPVNMMITVAMLEHWGVQATQAGDGEQAVAAVEGGGHRFDAVLMDLQMPRMDGYEATARLRRIHGVDRLPIIALTAAAMLSERERVQSAGMNDFVTKPIDAQRLHDALSRARVHARARGD